MRVLIFTTLLVLTSTLSADIYRWVDANGKTVYGDNPPESVRAKEVELPTLTVADSYLSKDKAAKEKPLAENKAEEEETVADSPTANPYEHFSVKYPDMDQVIRSTAAGLTVNLDIKPGLQQGHGVVLYLDGKQVARGASTSFALDGALERGEHTVFAVLHDAKKSVISNTETVNFTVVRSSVTR